MSALENYKNVQTAIKKLSNDAGIDEPTIIVVTKNRAKSDILPFLQDGVVHFGENRVQEALHKWKELKEEYPNTILHMIGPLQRNKVKDALSVFDFFHSVDRPSLVDEFIKHEDLIRSKKFFIQVNVGKESQKSGIPSNDLRDLVTYCDVKRLSIMGLMAIPPMGQDANEHFDRLKNLAKENGLCELSMGMSQDFDKAIQHGATYLRIGTRLFRVDEE